MKIKKKRYRIFESFAWHLKKDAPQNLNKKKMLIFQRIFLILPHLINNFVRFPSYIDAYGIKRQ
jgi:hypothetical protein